MNINNLSYWIGKDGGYTYLGSPNGTQADFPKFTGGFSLYGWYSLGANVKNDGYGDEIRVGGSTYITGTKAGRVIYDGSGNVLGSDDPNNHHVWRVRRDWDTVDLSMDASSFYATSPDDVDLDMISVVRAQYEYDWMNWPAAWGAPYEDLDKMVYDPYIDIPGYPGADQTIWLIANDVPNIVNALGE